MRNFIIFLLFSISCFANSSDQKEFFQERGFLWVKNFFSEKQVAMLRSISDEINETAKGLLLLDDQGKGLAQTIPGVPIVVAEALNPYQVCRTEDLLSCYPNLYHLIEGTITTFLGQLFDEPYVLFKDKLNYKWPNGGAFSPHQDHPAFELFGPTEFITAMVCIDEATLENGCLYIAENWKQDLLTDDHTILPYVVGGKDHGTIQKMWTDKLNWLPLKASPGDLVIFTSFVPHYSEINKSEEPRRALFLTYNKLFEGDLRKTYYYMKRNDPENPVFHFATPTKARNK